MCLPTGHIMRLKQLLKHCHCSEKTCFPEGELIRSFLCVNPSVWAPLSRRFMSFVWMSSEPPLTTLKSRLGCFTEITIKGTFVCPRCPCFRGGCSHVAYTSPFRRKRVIRALSRLSDMHLQPANKGSICKSTQTFTAVPASRRGDKLRK